MMSAADGEAGEPALRIRMWGVRGSVPTTCPSARRFGGNTPCVELEYADGRRLILDAGSGIRVLGRALARSGERVSADLFLTHFHWDHIQGLPFFEPLLSADTSVRIHAPRQGTLDGPLLLGKLASPTYVPIPLQAFAARIAFHEVTDAPWEEHGVRVRSVRAHHPSHTRAYRVDVDGVSLAYVPDHELHDAELPGTDAVAELVAGADVLVHDAMFTAGEYAVREGWGHSSMEAAAALAERAGVRLLCLFHHDPARTDRELASLVDQVRGAGNARRHVDAVRIEAAAEGDLIELVPGRDPLLQRRAQAEMAGVRADSSSPNC